MKKNPEDDQAEIKGKVLVVSQKDYGRVELQKENDSLVTIILKDIHCNASQEVLEDLINLQSTLVGMIAIHTTAKSQAKREIETGEYVNQPVLIRKIVDTEIVYDKGNCFNEDDDERYCQIRIILSNDY
jgi:hypothetical protein